MLEAHAGAREHATCTDRSQREDLMNKDQVEGSWEQMKGKAKRVWGELTDDDFIKADGSTDKLYGIIQQKFGDTKDAIKKKLEALRQA
jgi:uncharacterized protein YjbJ (UPF0337 family)